MATEYISREAAISLIDQHCFESGYDAVWMEEALKDIPAADVRPVVHGTWIDKCVRDWRCSVCDYGIQKIRVHDGYCYKDLPNFCPNCGADMREVVE